MIAKRALALAATCAMTALALAGCANPGSADSEDAISFGSVSYSQGQVTQAQDQLNDLFPAQTRQQIFRTTKVTRQGIVQFLMFSPGVEAGADATQSAQIDAQVTQLEKSLGGKNTQKLNKASHDVLRNLIATQTPGVRDQVVTHTQALLAKNPPTINKRYGSIDWKNGGIQLPRVGGGVTFASQQTLMGQ